jgi:glutathione S-transferase
MKIGQSKAMERYAAKKANLMGTSDEEAAIIDYISENVRDIKDKYGKIRATGGMGPNPEKEVAMKKWFDSECGEWLGKLEASLPSNADKKFTIGNKISYADINIWHLVKETFDDKDKANMIAAPYKRLTSIADHVAENDALKSWLASRPASKF